MKKRGHVEGQITGLHHITAFAGDPRRNVAFYTGVLGQRLIKKTVNFDDPGTWHLYYGDRAGYPGTVLTFFPVEGLGPGRAGAGSITHTGYRVPEGSLGYWEERLKKKGIATSRGIRFGEPFLGFADPDGLLLELVESADSLPAGYWEDGGIPESSAIRGFHSATALVHEEEGTSKVLEAELGYRLVKEEENRRRYESGDGGPGTYLDIVLDPSAPPVRQGAGIVHHLAFATPDDATQGQIRNQLTRSGYGVSGVRDRQYFHSIYFHEPNGILFEVATSNPGFVVDESIEELGSTLKLPPQYETYRSRIESVLPRI